MRNLAAVLCFLSLFTFCAVGSVSAAENQVAIINTKKVLAESEAGKKAKEALEKKMQELQATFKTEQEDLIALQEEIEKKGTVWSEEVRQEKAIDFQKKRRALTNKQEDANIELKKLEKELMTPFFKELDKVIKEAAVANGYLVVLPRQGVLFGSDNADITDEIIKIMNAEAK
jgi:outer membrane protein